MDVFQYNLHRVNVIRGIAVLMVYFFHVNAAVYGVKDKEINSCGFYLWDWEAITLYQLPTSFGWLGVAVFFSISGYCIHNSFCNVNFSITSVKQFLLKRFFRIYPAYFIVLILAALFHPYRNLSSDLQGLLQLTTHLFLIHNISARTFYGINPSFWSLALESQIYLLYLPILYLIRKSGWKFYLISLIILELFLRCGHTIFERIYGVNIPVALSIGMPFYYGFSWASGAIAAHMVRKNQLYTGSLLLYVPLCILTIIFAFNIYLQELAFVSAAIVTSLLLVTRVNYTDGISDGRLAKPLSLVGVISYSIYLIHQPALEWFIHWTQYYPEISESQQLILCVSLIIPVVALSAIFFKYVEVYFTNLGKKFR